MHKKIFFLVAIVITITMCLASCKINGGSDTDPDNIDNGGSNSNIDNSDTPSDNDGFVWKDGVAPNIILDGYSSEILDADSLIKCFYDLTGVPAIIAKEEHEVALHEILVGNVNREISKKAYKHLETLIGSNGEDEGWVIYSNGKSIAIAYSDGLSFDAAVDYLENEVFVQSTFAPKQGVVAEDVFDAYDYVEEKRNERREAELNALIPEIGEETVSQLKTLFRLYGTNLYMWMIDLYCPDIGGFYYSNSARNTEGFLPDIESTAQTMKFLYPAGLTTGYKGTFYAVPKEIGEQILKFAKGLQSSEDGYFYHPQWGKDISTSKLARDLAWSTQVISIFGGIPMYDTPSGVEGEFGAPGKVSSVSYLTMSLSVSKAQLVSKVIASNTSNLPSYLQDLGKWDAYIKELNIPYNSYDAGNTLSAQHDMILNAGQEYVDYLMNYLNNTQDPETGLWQAKDSSRNDYYALNGLMKISTLYEYYALEIPNAENAVKSCMNVILKADGDAHIVDVYNPWATLKYMLFSAERSGGEEALYEMRQTILLHAPELIESTIKKTCKYILGDGSFAYSGANTPPANMSQGAVVACASEPEGDINATTIASVGIVQSIFDVLGCKEVKLYGAEDTALMRDYWASLGQIIKKPLLESVVPITFDDYDESFVEIDRGVVLDPAEYTYNVVSDSDLNGNNYKWYSSSVVENPDSSAQSNDLVLKCETFIDPGAAKDKAETASYTGFELQGNTYNKNCYVFECDIYLITTPGGSSCVGQIGFASSVKSNGRRNPSFSLNLFKYYANGKTYIKIGENYEGLDGMKNDKITAGIPTEEWVNLKIEVYKYKENGENKIKGKVYVDGEYKGTCDAGYTGGDVVFKDFDIATVEYSHYRHTATVSYFNNVSVYAINKGYVAEDDYTGVPTGPEALDFEDYMTEGGTTYIHTYAPVSPNATYAVETVKDANGNDTKAYVYDSNIGGEDVFRINSYGIDADGKIVKANAFTYKADMKLDFNTDASNNQIKLQIGSMGSSRENAYYMLISLDKASGKVKLIDVGAQGNGNYVLTDIENGEWFNMRIEYYYISESKMLALTYINNVLVYVSNNYNCNNANDSNVWPVYDPDMYILPNGQSRSGIDRIQFTTLSNTDVTIYLDNCIIRRDVLDVPQVDKDDYTSFFGKDVTDDSDDENQGGGTTNPDDNTGDNTGSGDNNENGGENPGDIKPPSEGEIVDNLPDETWKN